MKIGLIDSGIGGLSVLNAFIQHPVCANYFYIADSGHLPYGTKSDAEIDERIRVLSHFLRYNCTVDVIVIACNTATAVSAKKIRDCFTDIPIIGIEPAIKPATQLTKTKHIAVAATRSTLMSKKFNQLIETFGKECQIHKIEAGSWVHLVENGHFSDDEAISIIESRLFFLKNYPIDQFILGCTHFPFLRQTIQDYLGNEVNLIDPAKSIVKQTLRRLEGVKEAPTFEVHYFTTGHLADFKKQLQALVLPKGTISVL